MTGQNHLILQAFGLALLRGMGYDPEKHKTKPIWHEKPRGRNATRNGIVMVIRCDKKYHGWVILNSRMLQDKPPFSYGFPVVFPA